MASFVLSQLTKLFRKKKGPSMAKASTFKRSNFKRYKGRYMKRTIGKPFMVKKTMLGDQFNVLVGTAPTQQHTAELNDVTDVTPYRALYDQYKIYKVKVHYRILQNVNGIQQNTANYVANSLGLIHSVVDDNDDANNATIPTMMNDNSYFCTKTNRDHIRTYTPKFLASAGGLQAQSKSGWLSTDAPNIKHYALKTLFQAGVGTAGTVSFTVQPIYTLWVGFKDQKGSP